MEENTKMNRALKRANDAFYKARKTSIKKVKNEKRIQKLDKREEFKLSQIALVTVNGSY